MEKPHKPLEAPRPTAPTNIADDVDEKLDDAVEMSFPASDPVAFISQPDNPEDPPADPLAPPPPPPEAAALSTQTAGRVRPVRRRRVRSPRQAREGDRDPG